MDTIQREVHFFSQVLRPSTRDGSGEPLCRLGACFLHMFIERAHQLISHLAASVLNGPQPDKVEPGHTQLLFQPNRVGTLMS